MSSLLTRSTPLFILCIVFFIAFSLLYYVKERDSMITGYVEGFSAPTRASDCRCLPGYLPSNIVSSLYGGEFQHFSGTIAFVPAQSSQKHWVPSCNMCGINICSTSVYKNVDKSTWDKTTWSSTFNCNTLKNAINQSKVPSTFFCQSKSDSTKRMSCY